MGRALDVGCGRGEFAIRLRARATHVDAIDIDSSSIASARVNTSAGGIHFLCEDFLRADLPENAYDVITAIASLHHMNLETALNRVSQLLRRGGFFVALGLHKDATPLDYLLGGTSLLLDLAIVPLTVRPRNGVALCPPSETFPAISQCVQRLMPGAHVRRHLFWRHSIAWMKA